MNETVISDYQINSKTLMLAPSFHPRYPLKVYEIGVEGFFYVESTAEELLNQACLLEFSTLAGRTEAVKILLRYYKKIPVLVMPHKKIYAIPTHSPRNILCHWIFPHNVLKYIPIRTKTKEKKRQTSMTTIDHREIIIDVSYEVLRNQIRKVSDCQIKYEQMTYNLIHWQKKIAEIENEYR